MSRTDYDLSCSANLLNRHSEYSGIICRCTSVAKAASAYTTRNRAVGEANEDAGQNKHLSAVRAQRGTSSAPQRCWFALRVV